MRGKLRDALEDVKDAVERGKGPPIDPLAAARAARAARLARAAAAPPTPSVSSDDSDDDDYIGFRPVSNQNMYVPMSTYCRDPRSRLTGRAQAASTIGLGANGRCVIRRPRGKKHGVAAFNIFDYDDPDHYPDNFWLPEADHFKTLSDSDDEYGAGYKRYAVGYTPMRATRRGPARRRAAARSARGARANKYSDSITIEFPITITSALTTSGGGDIQFFALEQSGSGTSFISAGPVGWGRFNQARRREMFSGSSGSFLTPASISM
eukprot:jgi/Mesvir1/26827/Mv20585-RA.1